MIQSAVNLVDIRTYFMALLQVVLVIAVILVGFAFYMMSMPGELLRKPLPALDPAEKELATRLRSHVWQLAEEIGERHYQAPTALAQAAEYIEESFARAGLTPVIEEFGQDNQTFRNIFVEFQGRNPDRDILVIGAHYDTVWLSPGADDNASGVAVLLETARLLQERFLDNSVRLVAFVNEESPFFNTDLMGSLVHARNAAIRGETISGMISLEMLGYFSGEPGSQHYPFPLKYFYPATGTFVAFVGNLDSRRFLRNGVGLFRESGRFPATGIAVPQRLVPDIRRSDHFAFWAQGIDAFMITDTANFRNPYYHTGGDLAKTLDYEAMARITLAITDMIEGLARQ
ncbi:MAG: M28 family peptidase [Gammaproteobacteria bacterium]|nr:M28 family peptidase [Gammaproteobacteria bacterium]